MLGRRLTSDLSEKKHTGQEPCATRLILCLLLCLAGCSTRADAAQDSGSFLQKTRTFHTLSEFRRLHAGWIRLERSVVWGPAQGPRLIGSRRGVVARNRDGTLEPFPGDRLLPWNEVTAIAQESPQVWWIATTRGAIRCDRSIIPSRMEYFAGRRWLPDDRVSAIGFESRTPPIVWIETSAGFSRIEYRRMTLEEKADFFQKRVRQRHLRHGLTAPSRLGAAGDLATSQTRSDDNDGLWTAMYVASECFRFRVSGAADARANARQGLQALMRLETITGIAGFPARSFVRAEAEQRPADGEWHSTPDRLWEWKGDTSSDEIVGHYLAYAVYYDLLADENERGTIREIVERITSHIVDNGYHLVDTDGRPTRWGWWAPEEIWADADETGLRALHLLSHLRTASHITGNPKFQDHYERLVARHRYALLVRNQKINVPGHVNHSDDELAFLSFYPLLLYETDASLRKVYIEALERSWQIERPERNPLWNYIYAAGSGSPAFDSAEALATLREIPLDLISWDVVNSHRLDVARDSLPDRFERRQAVAPLPFDERPMMKWNGNPYALDGGNGGRSEDDGGFFLLPYWLGRYHGFLR